MKKHFISSLFSVLLCLLFGVSFSQTTYDVAWENLSKATFSSTTLQRAGGVNGTAKATSENMLFGYSSSNRIMYNNGYMSYTSNTTNQTKKIGFSVTASQHTEITNTIDYGFAFQSNGKVKAFTADETSNAVNYSTSDELRIERKDDVISFYVGSNMVLELNVDPTESLMLRAEMTSNNSNFIGVKVSYDSRRFVVDPIIDNTASTMKMQISGGYSPFEYYWEDGELFKYPDLFVKEKKFSRGLHQLKIRDFGGVMHERYFLLGNDITWTSFSNTQQSGKTLSKTTGTGWGSALSTATIGNTDYFWVQYVADVQQVNKAFGLTYVGTSFTQYSNLQAGFMMLPENQLQVIYQGNVVLTTEYSGRDALLIARDGKSLQWMINGKAIYQQESSFTTDLKVGGLLKENATMTGVSMFNINNKPLLSTWNAADLSGQVDVNITSLTNGNSPYHYYISENPIPPLHDIYELTRNIDTTDTIVMDSLEFFQGAHLPVTLTYTFEALESGVYYVSVFDKTGLLILGDQIAVNPALEIYNTDGITLNSNLLASTKNNAITDLNYFIGDELQSGRIDFTVLNASEKHSMGLSDLDASTTAIQYGFLVNNKAVKFYVNGILENKKYQVKKNNILTLEKVGTELYYKINDVVFRQVTLTGTYTLKTQFEIAKAGTIIKVEPKKQSKKLYKYENLSVELTCEGGTSKLSFKIITAGGNNYLYTIRNLVDNSVFQAQTTGTNASTPFFLNIDKGIYWIHGSFTSIGNQTHYINEYIVIGVESDFEPTNNYVFTPNNYSPVTITTQDGSALTVNTIKADENGWFTLIPFFTEQEYLQHSLLTITSGTDINMPLTNHESFILFTKLPGNSLYSVKTYRFDEPTNHYVIESSNVPIPANTLLYCRIYNNGSQKVIEMKKANTTYNFVNFSLPLNEYRIKIHNIDINTGYKDILCSFNCQDDYDIYGVLKYELDGYYHIMKKGKIQFEYENEYEDTDLKFNIYSGFNNLIKNQNSFPVVPVRFGKNYITLDASDGAHCLGKGFFYLETINQKNERKYLRFYNDYNECEVPIENPSE